MRKKFIIIFVTASSVVEARQIIDVLLTKKLVACGNIINGIESKFWWQGKVGKANEALLILKGLAENFTKIESVVKKQHSYEVPEIIAIPIAAGSSSYLKWIEKSTTKKK